MTDRELLELAAKAAGYTLTGWERIPIAVELNASWNPLTDDGDALRLAVKLRIPTQFPFGDFEHLCREVVTWSTDQRHTEVLTGDPNAATRRAIVRAAAAIGEKQ